MNGGTVGRISIDEGSKLTVTGGKIICEEGAAISSYHGSVIISGDAYIENNSTEYATIYLLQPDEYLEIISGTVINKSGYSAIEQQFSGATIIINDDAKITPEYQG